MKCNHEAQSYIWVMEFSLATAEPKGMAHLQMQCQSSGCGATSFRPLSKLQTSCASAPSIAAEMDPIVTDMFIQCRKVLSLAADNVANV